MSGFNFEETHFDRPNQYRRLCPYCGKEFFDRKNRIYCCEQCKQDFNNQKAAKKRQRISLEIRAYSNNTEFLHDHCNEDEVQIDFSYAKERGFNFNGPYKNVKDFQDGSDWYKVGKFAYRTIPEKNKMIIKKVTDK
jgi:hypothetical protein